MDSMPLGEHEFHAERRCKPRSLVSVSVTMYTAQRRLVLRARTIDLSASGVLVHGSGPVRVGQTVAVEVERGAARNPLALRAEVVRIATPNEHRRQHGVALRFLDTNELDEAIIDSIIATARG